MAPGTERKAYRDSILSADLPQRTATSLQNKPASRGKKAQAVRLLIEAKLAEGAGPAEVALTPEGLSIEQKAAQEKLHETVKQMRRRRALTATRGMKSK